jgi:glycosyltransferase involved in cell wall biosynthesis
MPVYNGERFLRDALNSLLAQSFENFELIISDNASTDSTAAICEEFHRRDARIKYFRQPHNIGLFPNVHFVMKQALGDYFMVAGDDDIYAPTYVATLLQLLGSDQHVVLAYSNYAFITGDGVERPAPKLAMYSACHDGRFSNLRRFIPRRSCLPLMIGIFRIRALRQALPMPYSELAPMTGDVDNVFLVKILTLGRAASTRDVLFWYRLKDRASSFPPDWPKSPVAQRAYIAKHNVKVAQLMSRAICSSDLSVWKKMFLFFWNWAAFVFVVTAYLARA